MEPVLTSVGRKKQSLLLPAFLALLFITLAATGLGVWYHYPSWQEAPVATGKWTLVYEDKLYPGQALVADGVVLVAAPFLQEKLDPHLFWDEVEETAIITTRDKRLIMGTGQLTAYINNNPVEIPAPLVMIEGIPFLPVDFLTELYTLTISTTLETRRIVIQKPDKPLAVGIILPDKAYLRPKPVYRSPRLTGLAQGENLVILQEENGFFLVRTGQGLIGYIDKRAVKFTGVSVEEIPQTERFSWKPIGEKLNFTWEYVHSRTANPTTIGPLPGVNVVSPTWFQLKDEEGTLENKADMRYVQWAHDNGNQVWALVTNQFDRDLTHVVLSSTEKRRKVIDQLLVLSQLYKLDGINIDFENMHLPDRDLLTQFVRELTPLAHEQGLTVSVDVTIRSASENWSMIYDRQTLGEIVDYMAVMTYDEHWAASPKAGSVASLPWVERGLVGILEQVPKEKVLLGIPFYTRLWEETKQPDGTVKVSSRALSMETAEKMIKETNARYSLDKAAGQDYAAWTRGETTYKIWLENEDSIARRVQLARKYDLAGVASWRRGFEKPSIWPIIDTELKRR